MKIALSGVETTNKGSELMIYAILQEIEKKFPEAEVYIEADRVKTKNNYLKTTLKIKKINQLQRIINKLHVNWFLKKLHLPSVRIKPKAVNGCDYYLNAVGFHFSDQWKLSVNQVNKWKETLEAYKKENAKIVFLPQAFGPIQLPNTKNAFEIINKYADLIFPREKVSYNYIKESEIVDMNKVKIKTDFTSFVHGVFPKKYEYLKNEVCVIPNMRMIDKGVVSFENYISFMSQIISCSQKLGKKVYLLCHEGKKDAYLAKDCSAALNGTIEVVEGLNALEIKGLISSAYLVVSSRFHGVASALNSCVPCLATSWSHKYVELFNDYGQKDCVLSLDDVNGSISRVNEFIAISNNAKIREELKVSILDVQNATKKMWIDVWS
ncbi:MAG: polysaccharide pyruvyl transferase family protein [Bacteroidales bacterium]|nr:polysaccharide pyruvyl transferase family protein [Bacteroidales bacterium]